MASKFFDFISSFFHKTTGAELYCRRHNASDLLLQEAQKFEHPAELYKHLLLEGPRTALPAIELLSFTYTERQLVTMAIVMLMRLSETEKVDALLRELLLTVSGIRPSADIGERIKELREWNSNPDNVPLPILPALLELADLLVYNPAVRESGFRGTRSRIAQIIDRLGYDISQDPKVLLLPFETPFYQDAEARKCFERCRKPVSRKWITV